MKKRTRTFSRRNDAVPKHSGRNAAAPQLVTIEKPIYGGASLARVEGKAIFVPLALPGEQAQVRIVDEKRGYATAEVEEIVAAAPRARCAEVQTLWRVRRLPVPARGLQSAARI